jgi:hypothetical protein
MGHICLAQSQRGCGRVCGVLLEFAIAPGGALTDAQATLGCFIGNSLVPGQYRTENVAADFGTKSLL